MTQALPKLVTSFDVSLVASKSGKTCLISDRTSTQHRMVGYQMTLPACNPIKFCFVVPQSFFVET